MSEGFRNYEGNNNSLRPLIPQTTPFTQLSMFQGIHHATITSLFDHYVRLIRENNILTNQLKLINS